MDQNDLVECCFLVECGPRAAFCCASGRNARAAAGPASSRPVVARGPLGAMFPALPESTTNITAALTEVFESLGTGKAADGSTLDIRDHGARRVRNRASLARSVGDITINAVS